MWQKIIKDKRILGGLALLLVVAAVPLTLSLSQNQQDIRQRAATITPQVCALDQPTDVMMIFDKSGSMLSATSKTDSTERLVRAKSAVNTFINILMKRTETPLHAVSLTTISSEPQVSVVQPLTTNLSTLNSAVNRLSGGGSTCIECAIKKATADFETKERSNIKNIAVMLTDGGATQFVGGPADTSAANRAIAEKKAFDAAMAAHKKFNMAFYTIGFGDSIKDQLLINIATSSGGMYYFAPDAATLTAIYQKLAQVAGQGSISGVVYNDANSNKIQDASEIGQAGWKVDLLNSSNQIIATTTTDDQGHYIFQGVCDGTYKAKLTVQSGWSITSPANTDSLSVTITKGNVVSNQNFGVNQGPKRTTLSCSPTDIVLTSTNQAITATLKDSTNTAIPGKVITWTVTGGNAQLSTSSSTTTTVGVATTNVLVPASSAGFNGTIVGTYAGDAQNSPSTCSISSHFTPQATSLTITMFLHGIGNSGDNVNPAFTLSNKNPIHTNRNLVVSIYDTKDNKLVKEVNSNNLAYNNAITAGNYSAVVDLGNSFSTGNYIVQIKTDYHLRKQFPGAIRITANQNNILTPITLVAGDVDNGNQIDIRDYNALIDCYSDFEAAVACDADKKLANDLNDDGKVEQFDYNLLLREWLVQNGDIVGI